MKLACAQLDVVFGEPEDNAQRAIDLLSELVHDGVDFAVFPECFLTGYVVGSPDEASSIAIEFDSDPIRRMADHCRSIGIYAVVGFAGRRGKSLYNAAAMFSPDQEPKFAIKTHLPCLGLDRFVAPGDELALFETRFGRVGVLICYDMRMPEATRSLALRGADLVVLPTNWPRGAQVSAEHICIARAAENHIFFAACNRAGDEAGSHFIGRSKIIGPTGAVLAAAGESEEIVTAEIKLSEARNKRVVNIPGEYELEIFGARRPELYGPITD